jgi:hypothetical protein
MDGLKVDITDEDIDAVGEIRFEKGVGRVTVQTPEEGVTFVRVVETALNYILDWRHKLPLRARPSARAKLTSKQMIKQRVANNRGGLIPFRR